MNTFKTNLTSLALLLAAQYSALAIGATESEAELDKANKRIPTEELIEGIKSRDGRWFEVEILVFEQTGDTPLREVFEEEVKNIKPSRYWPLVDQARKYNVERLLSTLPNCLNDFDPLLSDEEVTPNEFYQQYQLTYKLLENEWRTNSLMCLTSNESLSPFWQIMTDSEIAGPQYNLTLPAEEKMPERITGADYDDFRDVYVIAPQNLELGEHYDALQRSKDARPLLHIGWRQPGLSERKAVPVYLYGGKNWTEAFYYDGTPKPPKLEEAENPEAVSNNSLDEGIVEGPNLISQAPTSVDRFMEKLQQGAVVDFDNNKLVFPDVSDMPNETWEFDGYITVHLNHYLFLDAAFNFRQQQSKSVDTAFMLAKDNLLEPTEEQRDSEVIIQTLADGNDTGLPPTSLNDSQMMEINYLQTYSLKQNRRTYSGDLHYLDHPKIGVIFQIRKYRH